MADLTYMVAIGFDEDNLIVAQATTLVDDDSDMTEEYTTLRGIVAEQSDDVMRMLVAVMTSAGYGDEKTADGKDRYRVHRLLDGDTASRLGRVPSSTLYGIVRGNDDRHDNQGGLLP